MHNSPGYAIFFSLTLFCYGQAGCSKSENSPDKNDETPHELDYPDLPVGLIEASSQWVHSHKSDWPTWEQQASTGKPLGRYLHNLRRAFESPADVRALLADGANSELSEARMTFGLWLFAQEDRNDRLTGMSWIREAAIRGLAAAQWEMSKAYREGSLLPKDQSEESRYAVMAAEGGENDALFRVAQLCVIDDELDAENYVVQLESIQSPDKYVRCALGSVWLRIGDEQQREKGRELLESAYGEGLAEAATVIGLHLLEEAEDPATRKQGVDWLEKANVAGHNTAALILSHVYLEPEIYALPPAECRLRRIGTLEVAAARGNAIAQYRLALLVEPTDHKRSLELAEKSVIGGHLPAWADALRMKHSPGATQIETELRTAAFRKDPFASLALAQLIDEAKVPGDTEEVFRLATIAYDSLEAPRAALLIGKYYLHGDAGRANPVEATRWLSIAAHDANEPVPEAVRLLRNAYDQGIGLLKNAEMVAKLDARLKLLAQ